MDALQDQLLESMMTNETEEVRNEKREKPGAKQATVRNVRRLMKMAQESAGKPW